jgi:sulfur transfer complex TusBCD TusB component (DsrH family)
MFALLEWNRVTEKWEPRIIRFYNLKDAITARGATAQIVWLRTEK